MTGDKGKPEHKYAVLIVDDDNLLLNSFSRMLRSGNYRVITADSGNEALEILAQENVSVVLSDYRMPGMTGQQLLEKVREQYPATTRMMMSGTDRPHDGVAHYFIPKPFDPHEVRMAIEDGLADHVKRIEEEYMRKPE